jgi:hypothetical protein
MGDKHTRYQICIPSLRSTPSILRLPNLWELHIGTIQAAVVERRRETNNRVWDESKGLEKAHYGGLWRSRVLAIFNSLLLVETRADDPVLLLSIDGAVADEATERFWKEEENEDIDRSACNT